MSTLNFALKAAGYCTSKKSFALQGANPDTIRFYASYAHLQHPEYGHILFDTGYSCRFYEHTQKYPFRLYAQLTPVYVREEEEALATLRKVGIPPEDVRYIIISHFHADHIGGLRDFPNATFICSADAFSSVDGLRGMAALRQGFIPALLPGDFQERLELLDFSQSQASDQYLGPLYDLLRDGSIQLCQLPGHAAGQIGALLNTQMGKVFLVSDAAWLRQNFKNMHLPHWMVRLFFDSWTAYKASLRRVHNFHQSNPDYQIVPCHCRETYEQLTEHTAV